MVFIFGQNFYFPSFRPTLTVMKCDYCQDIRIWHYRIQNPLWLTYDIARDSLNGFQIRFRWTLRRNLNGGFRLENGRDKLIDDYVIFFGIQRGKSFGAKWEPISIKWYKTRPHKPNVEHYHLKYAIYYRK